MDSKNVISKSRSSTVRILVNSDIPVGTGFFIDNEHVATCFHVVAKLEQSGSSINPVLYPNIRVVLINSEVIDAECISIPSQQDISPVKHDFAVLKLNSKPQMAISALPLYSWETPPEVGDVVYFSGYPLDAQMMMTHKGMISGINSNIIGIQAPTNKGNSGSALLTATGEVLGIVSMREGRITKRLLQILQNIKDTEKGPVKATIEISGTDPIESIKELINTLDRYISTGIGYARTIEHLRDYLKKHCLAQD